MPVTPAEPQLRFPGGVADGARQRVDAVVLGEGELAAGMIRPILANLS